MNEIISLGQAKQLLDNAPTDTPWKIIDETRLVVGEDDGLIAELDPEWFELDPHSLLVAAPDLARTVITQAQLIERILAADREHLRQWSQLHRIEDAARDSQFAESLNRQRTMMKWIVQIRWSESGPWRDVQTTDSLADALVYWRENIKLQEKPAHMKRLLRSERFFSENHFDCTPQEGKDNE